MEKELIVDFAEIQRIGVTCKGCDATVIDDVAVLPERPLLTCNRCGVAFGELGRENTGLRQLAMALEEVRKDKKLQITLHLTIPAGNRGGSRDGIGQFSSGQSEQN